MIMKGGGTYWEKPPSQCDLFTAFCTWTAVGLNSTVKALNHGTLLCHHCNVRRRLLVVELLMWDFPAYGLCYEAAGSSDPMIRTVQVNAEV